MGKGKSSGNGLLVEELFERGERSFVDELRKFDDADVLGAFAPRWLADRRPEATRLLLEYLDRPLNAYRHEALVKRLFKLAEAAADDELMGAFLVAFDRSVRRVRRRDRHFEYRTVATEKEANALAAAWRNQGFESVSVWRNWRKQHQVMGRWSAPSLVTPAGTTMPRGTMLRWTGFPVPDWAFAAPGSIRGLFVTTIEFPSRNA